MKATTRVVMTGGTSGLGLHAVAALLDGDSGVRLVVGSQDARRGATAISDLVGHTASRRVEVLELNLGDLKGVGAFARAAEERLDGVDVVVANGGVQYPDARRRTADGLEATFGVNVVGHFALLQAVGVTARPMRVVLTSSGTHHDLRRYRLGFPRPKWRDLDELVCPDDGRPDRQAGSIAYSTSKLALVHLGHELARRQHPDGTVVVYDPGLVPGTGLARELPAPARVVFTWLAPALRVLPTVTSPERAGRNLARLVLDPVEGPYVALDRVVPSSRESYDPARERHLWDGLSALIAATIAGSKAARSTLAVDTTVDRAPTA